MRSAEQGAGGKDATDIQDVCEEQGTTRGLTQAGQRGKGKVNVQHHLELGDIRE